VPVDEPLDEALARARLVLADVVAAADEMLAVGVDGLLQPLADRSRLLPVLELALLDLRPQVACALGVHGCAYRPAVLNCQACRGPPAKAMLAR